MACEFCNGSGETVVAAVHEATNITRMVSRPCFCLTSAVISRENKLLHAFGNHYMHPDKMDPQLVFLPNDLAHSPNLVIHGDFDPYLLNVKALLMKHRFANPKPRILFARSIDILHDYYVPKDVGEVSLRLATVTIFDLAIINFGSIERNVALAPCMAQVVENRIEEKRPTWIYLPPNKDSFVLCDQENSADLEKMIGSFPVITIKSDESGIVKNSISKADAANFNVGAP